MKLLSKNNQVLSIEVALRLLPDPYLLDPAPARPVLIKAHPTDLRQSYFVTFNTDTSMMSLGKAEGMIAELPGPFWKTAAPKKVIEAQAHSPDDVL